MRRNMLVMTIIICAAMAFVATLMCGCPPGEEEDPALLMLQQAERDTGTAAAQPDDAEAAEPAAEAADDGAPAAEDGAEADAADDEPAAEAEETAADEEAVDESEPAEDDEAAEDEEATAEEEPVGDEEPAAEEEDDDQELPSQAVAAPGPVDEEAEPDEEEVEGEEGDTGDPVENFKNLDPRDIIIKKYDDLEERKTEPWDEESEEYIPNTGRVDPLTRVRSAVPDELKPPRAGETDMNEINTYLIADAATMIVDVVAYSLSCHNVIQIGLMRYASFSYLGGPPFPLEEGFSTSQNAGSVNGIPIIVTITLTTVSTDQVVLRINAAGQGTSTSVTKNQTYIPRTAF